MSTPFRLLLPRTLYAEMLAQARAEYPLECCGLLAGRIETAAGTAPLARVLCRYPLVNELASPTEYLSEPRSLLAADKDMRKHGYDLLAAYHSHPTSEPVPSRKDIERNYGAIPFHFIISLTHEEPVMRGWWLREDGYAEAEWQCDEAR